MITHILKKEEIQDLKSIISLLKSNDKESILLGFSLLRAYPYTMISIFDINNFSRENRKVRQVGYVTENKSVNKLIQILEEIIEDERYCSTEDERGLQPDWYDWTS